MNMNMSWLRVSINNIKRAVRIRTTARKIKQISKNMLRKRKRSRTTRLLSDRLLHRSLRW